MQRSLRSEILPSATPRAAEAKLKQMRMVAQARALPTPRKATGKREEPNPTPPITGLTRNAKVNNLTAPGGRSGDYVESFDSTSATGPRRASRQPSPAQRCTREASPAAAAAERMPRVR